MARTRCLFNFYSDVPALQARRMAIQGRHHLGDLWRQSTTSTDRQSLLMITDFPTGWLTSYIPLCEVKQTPAGLFHFSCFLCVDAKSGEPHG